MAAQSRTYSTQDMMRMQQDAVARVREMQERARRNVEGDEPADPAAQGWDSSPGVQRRGRPGRSGPASGAPRPRGTPQPPPRRQTAPPPEAEPRPEPEHRPEPEPEAAPPPPSSPPPPADPAAPRSGTTLLQDIFGAVGLDDDRLLIAGLILLLVNAKADTTLILALCYLLI